MFDLYALFDTISADLTSQFPRLSGLLPLDPFGTFGKFTDIPSATTGEVAALALAKSIGKKCVDVVSDNAADACLLSYVQTNASCSEWVPPKKVATPRMVVEGRVRDNPEYEGLVAVSNAQLLERVRKALRDTFQRPTPEILMRSHLGFDGSNPWSWENIFLCGDVGPGAASAASGVTWYDKFYQSTLTYTSPIIWRAYIDSLSPNSVRWYAEEQRYQAFGNEQVLGGKYGSVLKSFSTDRSIDVQPSLNMVGQKGLATIAVSFLQQKYGFNLALQPSVNAELARRGSLDGKSATLDLKDASNRIPWDFVKWALDGCEILPFLEILRTEQTLMPWGTWLPNHMCSGMGNGFTFVLQTAIFYAVLEAVYELHDRVIERVPPLGMSYLDSIHSLLGIVADCDIPSELDEIRRETLKLRIASDLQGENLPDCGVFGDDMICPVSMFSDVVKALRLINAELNLEKSFSTTSFRESCGADWFAGAPVRGVYCKTLNSTQGRVITLNRLIEWSAITGISLENTCLALWKTLKRDVTTVPLHESHFAGLRVTQGRHRDLPLSKECSGFQRDYQVKVKTYLAYVPVVRKRSFTGAQTCIYGPGILLSMIRGDCRSSFADTTCGTVRESAKARNDSYSMATASREKTSFEQRWCWTSCWDNTLHPYYDAAKMDAALSRNLGSLPM